MRPSRFRPREGEVVCQGFRGNAGHCCLDSFRPREGEVVCQEFTFGTLIERGFEIPQSTHS